MALVEVNNKIEECYMPTSSKLGKVIKLENQIVYLKENNGQKLRTKYKVHSLEISKKNLILLDLNCLNSLFYNEVLRKNTDYIPEKKVENLKVDFYNKDLKEVIEIKGLLSDTDKVIFPYYNSKRIIRQLKELAKIEADSKKIIFILMNQNICEIELDVSNKEFIKNFRKAQRNKIKVEFYKVEINKEKEALKKVDMFFRNNVFKIKNSK